MTGMYRASLKQEGITPHEEKLIELEVCKRVKIHSKELKEKYQKIYSKNPAKLHNEEEVKTDSQRNNLVQIPKKHININQKLEDYIAKFQLVSEERDYYKKYQDTTETAISDINYIKNYKIFEGIINGALDSYITFDYNTTLNINLANEKY